MKMTLFKNMFRTEQMPTGETKPVTVINSVSIVWYTRERGYDTIRHAKTFVDEHTADEFRDQLLKCANFIGAWISTEKQHH